MRWESMVGVAGVCQLNGGRVDRLLEPLLILLASITMQTHEEQDPTVRIRDLKKDRVNFVLENVDLAYGQS
jgi:hypothetical protein